MKDQPNALSFGSTDSSTPCMTFTDIVFTHKDAGMKYVLRITRHNAVFCQHGCWIKSAGLGRPAAFPFVLRHQVEATINGKLLPKFKNLILNYPIQALQLFTQPEADALGPGFSITPIRQEQLKRKLRDLFRELDVPLEATWPNGKKEAFLFVLEEETDPRRFSTHRLAHYCLDLSELRNSKRVVPVVIFCAAKPSTYRYV